MGDIAQAGAAWQERAFAMLSPLKLAGVPEDAEPSVPPEVRSMILIVAAAPILVVTHTQIDASMVTEGLALAGPVEGWIPVIVGWWTSCALQFLYLGRPEGLFVAPLLTASVVTSTNPEDSPGGAAECDAVCYLHYAFTGLLVLAEAAGLLRMGVAKWAVALATASAGTFAGLFLLGQHFGADAPQSRDALHRMAGAIEMCTLVLARALACTVKARVPPVEDAGEE